MAAFRSHQRIVCFLACLSCLLASSHCKDKAPEETWEGEVEIAPSQWLTIRGELGRAWFRCTWNDKEIYWKGDYHEGSAGSYDRELPVCLRTWKETLYLIYRRINVQRGLSEFGYATLDKSGTRFEAMDRKFFPRVIATQNIGVDREGIAHDEHNNPVDNLRIIRKLDVTNQYFHNSTTGWIWYHLEKGLAREEVEDTPAESMAFYAEYVKKYHPIALPTLIKEEKRTRLRGTRSNQ